MSGQVVVLDDLVVASGQTASNSLLAGRDYRDADSITLFGPAVLAEVATVQVGPDEDTGGVWSALSRGGADVTVAAGKAVTIELPSFRRVRINLGGAAAADRTFGVNKGFWA